MDPTPANLARAKQFVLERWRERAEELEHPVPTDLSGACKFASLFAQAVFGGKLRGSWRHQYVELNGQIIDLTGDTIHYHDRDFWMNRQHRESLESCKPRVQSWLEQWKIETPQ